MSVFVSFWRFATNSFKSGQKKHSSKCIFKDSCESIATKMKEKWLLNAYLARFLQHISVSLQGMAINGMESGRDRWERPKSEKRMLQCSLSGSGSVQPTASLYPKMSQGSGWALLSITVCWNLITFLGTKSKILTWHLSSVLGSSDRWEFRWASAVRWKRSKNRIAVSAPHDKVSGKVYVFHIIVFPKCFFHN